MITIKHNPSDKRYMFLIGENKEMSALESYLNKIPQWQFLPSFRGIPKPEVFLNKFKKGDKVIYYCHGGLWKCITDWCEANNIETSGVEPDFIYTNFNLTLEEFEVYVSGWNLNIDPRGYQIKSAWMILKYRNSLSQLATRAGKTLIAYIVFRYMLENGAKNILMVVPNISLVKQGVQDMKDYKEFFQSEEVWAKGESCECSNLTIGTFQSLIKKLDRKSKKYNPKFFDKFDVVCIDEAHTSKCSSINAILSQNFLKECKLKFGFSGSLPDDHTIDSFACQSLIGPMIQDIRSKELMDQGFITPAEITQVRINYDEKDLIKDYIECGEYLCGNYKEVDKKKVLRPKEQRKFTMTHEKSLPYSIEQLKKLYDDREYMMYLVDLCKSKGSNLLMLEQMLVHQSQKRLDVIEDLLRGFEKNSIVFAHHTEYLNHLHNYFKTKFPDRNVYLITGSTTQKKRDVIIKALLEDKNAILFASYGCVGTGLTLKNIDYGIFAQSFKSQIINKQALGRGLCLANDKDKYRLYDIIDCFPTKKLYMQGIAKAKLFKKENFEFYIKDVK